MGYGVPAAVAARLVHPDRVHATSLSNPDFAAWARSFGAHGERVTRSEEFAAAFERSIGAGKAAVIELCIDPDVINTRTTLSAMRRKATRRPPT